MKKLLIALCICSISVIKAQKTTTFYTTGQKSSEGEFVYIAKDNLFDEIEKNDDYYYDKYRETKITQIKNGGYTSWYKNGNKKEIGTYVMNIPHGKFEFYYENGNKMAEGQFHYGLRMGAWVIYYQNGTKKITGNFDKYSTKEFDSIFAKSSEKKYSAFSGRKSHNQKYKKVEHAQKWNDTDVEKIEKKLSDNDSKKNGKFIFYRENGQVEFECVYNNNLKQGKWLFYFANGKLAKELMFEADSCKGKAVEYYETGNKLYEGEIVGGIELVENVWNESGQQVIKNGTGEHIQLYENGKTRVKRYYKNGLMDKTWYWYRLDGSLDQEASYKEGRIQSQIFYDTNGHLSEEYFYENDEVKRSREYENGKLIDEYNK